jgi:hypothetical protein
MSHAENILTNDNVTVNIVKKHSNPKPQKITVTVIVQTISAKYLIEDSFGSKLIIDESLSIRLQDLINVVKSKTSYFIDVNRYDEYSIFIGRLPYDGSIKILNSQMNDFITALESIYPALEKL